MKYIFALCDYKGYFGSKYYPVIYRSGMDKNKLSSFFYEYGYNIQYINMSVAPLEIEVDSNPFIYSSQEDSKYLYKNFIEDIIYGLEIKGAITIPSYKFLRATNNKVFMEILRNQLLPNKYNIKSLLFGTVDELMASLDNIFYPCIVKTAGGAVSKGVFKANSKRELLSIVRRISRSKDKKYELIDRVRAIRHPGYKRDSLYRSKFIVQDYYSGIFNDWKVLVFYDKIYVLRRNNRPNDFRASGSGLFSFDEKVDERLLESAEEIRKCLNIPMVSLDLSFQDDKVVLFEFQGVHFGVSTLEKSHYYYTKINGVWEQIYTKSVLEEIYAETIVKYLEERNLK